MHRDERREERRQWIERLLLRLAISSICVILATPPSLGIVVLLAVMVAHELHIDHLLRYWNFQVNQFATSGVLLVIALCIWFVPINERRFRRRR